LIDSSLVDSPWPAHHPGKVFQPDFDDLMDKLENQYSNREAEGLAGWNRAAVVREDYDWITLTDKAFAHLL
jgi:hypothetical protein